MIEIVGKDRLRRLFFGLFALSATVCVIATTLHYTRRYPGNPLTWVAWLASLGLLLATYFPSRPEIKRWTASLWDDKWFVRVFGILALLFVVSHIWNFKTAPWNQNGLFDDAAWDIYFAKKYVFAHEPFQAAWPDGIAREIIFHYYISIWFVLFGYNLLVFNISLLVLGLCTLLFTCLIIQALLKNYFVTIVSGVVFNFLPLHFIQTFIGHRYAMAAPLLTASLYFLITAFLYRSKFRVALSAILAALCVDSAIMGKQFVMCLIATAVLSAITSYRRTITKENIGFAAIFLVGLAASMVPLILFVQYHWRIYFGHESDLSAVFFQAYKNRASGAFNPYIADLKGIFFDAYNGKRLSMQDAVIIPFPYYVFLVPGLVIALIKKRFEIVLLATVPILGAFISTAYDFRVLHAAPFWIILIAYALHALTRLETITRSYLINLTAFAIAGCILAAGLVPSVRYLYGKTKDPYSIYLLGQHDVAVARFVRDIVAGVPHPSVRRRHNEFRKLPNLPEPAYDSFVCDESSFAISHLFLQDYNDRQIMSFCEQAPMMNATETSVFAMNKSAVSNYSGSKGIMMIWQQSSKSARTIAAFGKLSRLGEARLLMARHAGRVFVFYVLAIPAGNVRQFKQELAGLRL
jgi:hypothetical protein